MWPYGGLTRDVHLVSVPDAHIVNAKLQLAKGQTDKLTLSATTEGVKTGSQLRVQIPALGVDRQFRFPIAVG